MARMHKQETLSNRPEGEEPLSACVLSSLVPALLETMEFDVKRDTLEEHIKCSTGVMGEESQFPKDQIFRFAFKVITAVKGTVVANLHHQLDDI